MEAELLQVSPRSTELIDAPDNFRHVIQTQPPAASASGLNFVIPLSGTSSQTSGRPWQLGVKRTIDVVLASLALLFLGPLLLAVALAIKAGSPGPVLFVQPRYGRDGKIFRIFKFRTMFTHLEDRSGAQQTIAGDDRVTPLGRWLRKTSVDELPQLLNVIRGDMALIGPRPHPLRMLAAGQPYEQLVPYYGARLAMRPGLSGWAQVNGYRGPTDSAEAAIGRVDHDLAYIQNFSLGLDLTILVRTIRSEFLGGSGF
jgi:lipopolysaccharide/colanic/teichoic acid biosynthesis glycosyltransferase